MNQEMKHTPGPWHIGMKPGPIVYGPKGEQVADLTADLIPKDERLANLRLILSAPELLDALDTLTLVVGLTPIAGNKSALQEAFNAARIAIAKATSR